MTIKLIVGLANPGEIYYKTRHNVGAWYIYLIAKYLHVSLYKNPKFHGFTSSINLIGTNVHILVPTTFMNMSGKAVSAIANFYNINSKDILIVHDDLDLPPGTAKFKFGGSYRGHNGLNDIIKNLKNDSYFYRLRLGIGHPGNKEEVANFLLSEPTIAEKKLIQNVINRSVLCTKILFKEGLVKAMNCLHAYKA